LGDDAIDLVCRKSDGSLGQQLLYADALDAFSIETEDLPWKFDADAVQVWLTSEARRIKLARLFDPHLAIHASLSLDLAKLRRSARIAFEKKITV
jgi:hypothetical protein